MNALVAAGLGAVEIALVWSCASFGVMGGVLLLRRSLLDGGLCIALAAASALALFGLFGAGTGVSP